MNTTYLSLEIKRIVRSPQFTIFTIGMPVAMFLLFGSIFGKLVAPNGLPADVQTMINLAAYGASGGALFTGTRVAQERTDGWQRQLRLTPMRGPGYLVVKVISAMAVALPVLVVVFAAGLAMGVQMSAAQWAWSWCRCGSARSRSPCSAWPSACSARVTRSARSPAR